MLQKKEQDQLPLAYNRNKLFRTDINIQQVRARVAEEIIWLLSVLNYLGWDGLSLKGFIRTSMQVRS